MDATMRAIALAVFGVGFWAMVLSLISGFVDGLFDGESQEAGEHAAPQAPAPRLAPLIFVCEACRLIEGRQAHACPHGAIVLALERDDILGSEAGLPYERFRGRRWCRNLYRGRLPEIEQDMLLEAFAVGGESGVWTWQ